MHHCCLPTLLWSLSARWFLLTYWAMPPSSPSQRSSSCSAGTSWIATIFPSIGSGWTIYQQWSILTKGSWWISFSQHTSSCMIPKEMQWLEIWSCSKCRSAEMSVISGTWLFISWGGRFFIEYFFILSFASFPRIRGHEDQAREIWSYSTNIVFLLWNCGCVFQNLVDRTTYPYKFFN